MLIDYKGVKIDTFRPLTFNEKRILEQLEEETPVRIQYNGKRWINTNLGIKVSTPTILGDVTTIKYNGSWINLSTPLKEYDSKLLDQIEKKYGLKFQYTSINKNDQYLIEYKGARIDLSNPLNDSEMLLLKQMEKDLIDNMSKVKELESRLAEEIKISKRNSNIKNTSTLYINGGEYIYEFNENSRHLYFKGNRIDMAAPLDTRALNTLSQMIKEKKIRLDHHSGKLIWMTSMYYSESTGQPFTEESSEDHDENPDIGLDF